MENRKLILMSCCAPCSCNAIKKLKNDGYDFVVLFHNPNIFPRAEYDKRLAEQIKFCEKHNVKYAYSAEGQNHDAWLKAIKGIENGPERGPRCEKCFAMRLQYGAEWARKNGYKQITSVFGVSLHKDNAQVLCAAESVMSSDSDVKYIDMDFGYMPEADMYRQRYCGCEFSETYHEA